jgi:hypothetical protein
MKNTVSIGLISVCALMCSCAKSNSSNLEAALGIALPRNTANCMIRVEHRPDYNHIELKTRFDLPIEGWNELCSKLRLSPTEIAMPYENIPFEIRSWWNVPSKEQQKIKATRVSSRGVISALWWNGCVYLEFAGFPPAAGD